MQVSKGRQYGQIPLLVPACNDQSCLQHILQDTISLGCQLHQGVHQGVHQGGLCAGPWLVLLHCVHCSHEDAQVVWSCHSMVQYGTGC